MGSTLFVEYQSEGFWLYDVISNAFVKMLVEEALEVLENNPSSWLQDAIEGWKVNTKVSDFGLFLDEEWCSSQVSEVTGFCGSVIGKLKLSDYIECSDLGWWNDGTLTEIDFRGTDSIKTSSLIDLGRALVALLEGNLAVAPQGNWWFYGIDGLDLLPKLH